jgi:hypothetical protein
MAHAVFRPLSAAFLTPSSLQYLPLLRNTHKERHSSNQDCMYLQCCTCRKTKMLHAAVARSALMLQIRDSAYAPITAGCPDIKHTQQSADVCCHAVVLIGAADTR